MKDNNIIFASLLLASLGVVFCACSDEYEALRIDGSIVLTDESYGNLKSDNVVATGEAKDITTSSATILFSANYNYKEKLQLRPGILISTNKSHVEDCTKDATLYELEKFNSSECSITLNNLQDNTTYYYRACDCENYQYYSGNYGDVKSFTTDIYRTAGTSVDLGLSVKWADRNIGATNPQESGYTFQWGSTKPSKSSYDNNWLSGNCGYLKSLGSIDSDDNLCAPYDAATQIWGSNWRMPTKGEYEELIDKCTFKTCWRNGVNGIEVTGPNGNTLFIPGSTRIWTATAYDTDAWIGDFNSSSGYMWISSRDRNHILYIRPVLK